MKKSTVILSATFLVIVVLVMYLLNLFTPLFCDDWHYPFIFNTHDRIASLGDIFASQFRHYFHFNGRFIVHCFVQLFDGLLGKGLFNVVNAIFFAVFLYAIALVSSRDKGDYYKIISVAFILLFMLMPGFKHVFLWLSGSCNYLWVGTMTLFFIHLLMKDAAPSCNRWLLLAFGLVCGWSNEAIALGLGASLVLYFAMHRKQLTVHRKYMIIGFCLGLMALVFSPGTLRRALGATTGGIEFLTRLSNMGNLRFFLLLLALVVGKAIFGRRGFMQWIKREQVLLMAALMSAIFIFMTGDYHDQSRFGIELFSLLVLLRSINWKRISTLAVSIANVATLAFAFYVVSVCATCDKANRTELASITGDHCIVPTTQFIPMNSFLHRYALDYAGFFVDDNKFAGEHLWISEYYGYHDVVFLPQIFIDDLKEHYEAYDGHFRTIDNLPFFAMRLPEKKAYRYGHVTYRVNPDATFLDRIMSRLKGEVDDYYADAWVVTVNGDHYVFVVRFHPSQDDRIEKITLG